MSKTCLEGIPEILLQKSWENSCRCTVENLADISGGNPWGNFGEASKETPRETSREIQEKTLVKNRKNKEQSRRPSMNNLGEVRENLQKELSEKSRRKLHKQFRKILPGKTPVAILEEPI